MKIIDISWPISAAMTAYKDRKVVAFHQTKTFDRDGARESTIHIGSHSGTHVDAPAHFLQEGVTIDKVALETLCGPCVVIDCTAISERITADFLIQQPIGENDIIVCKTRNSFLSSEDIFNATFVYIDADAAHYLVQKKIKAIGIDYLGIERAQPLHDTHTILMTYGVSIIEGLRLSYVQPGRYHLWCLPLAIIGLEAAPARAILVQD